LEGNCCARNGLCVLYVRSNGLGSRRFGVSASKKLGGAVVRNRLKRFGREAFRLRQHEIADNCDYLLIFAAKKPKNVKTIVWHEVEFEQIRCSFAKLSEQALAKLRRQVI
jgi:ribonuclease P protein component